MKHQKHDDPDRKGVSEPALIGKQDDCGETHDHRQDDQCSQKFHGVERHPGAQNHLGQKDCQEKGSHPVSRKTGRNGNNGEQNQNDKDALCRAFLGGVEG